MKYYVDTCIWIDYWENRSDNLRPLGEFALRFFSNLEDDDMIYYSELTLKELHTKYSDIIIEEIFKIIESNLIFIKVTSFHFSAADVIASTGLAHKSDALHIVLAKECGAKFITRDKQILLSGLIDALRPEDLI